MYRSFVVNPESGSTSLCCTRLTICLNPRIPLCSRLACGNAIVFPLSLRNTSSSEKRARKERTGQWSMVGMMWPCMLSLKRTEPQSSAQCLKMKTVWSLERCSCGSSEKDTQPAPQPQGTASGAGRHRCWGGGDNISYITVMLFPGHTNALVEDNTIHLIYMFQDHLHIKWAKTNIHTCMRPKHPKSSQCWILHMQMMRRKKWKQSWGRLFHPSTLGNWERKQPAAEGWNTCSWTLIAFKVASLPILKGVSILVPCCTRLENNMQK